MNTREKREEEWDEKYDGRCPIYQDEEPWVYETEKGWAWRIDYIGNFYFKTEKEAYEDAVDWRKENAIPVLT
ncbi:MAG TPA: hypothetical protein EYO59_02860 [Chromatiaceae bacterium]|nr:hypothetical protein [Chromatiaceae bacterium]